MIPGGRGRAIGGVQRSLVASNRGRTRRFGAPRIEPLEVPTLREVVKKLADEVHGSLAAAAV